MRRNLAPSRLGTNQLKGFVPPLRSGSSNSVSNQSAPASGATSQPQNADIRPSPVLPAIKAPPVSESLPMGAPGSRYFNAVWCKQSTRKHKKWEGDAFLIAKPPQSRLVILKDPQGKEIGRGSGLAISKIQELESGSTISFSGKEVELLEEISETQFRSGVAASTKENAAIQAQAEAADAAESSGASMSSTPIRYKPFAVPARVANPFPVYSKGGQLKPMFDPDHPEAIVMPRPPGSDVTLDVVVDPHIGRQLRPHQVEGIIFLYKCVMGIQVEGSQGAILADEMGLGKTLQTIALVWTLLRQGPYGKPVIKRVMVLAPSSLVKNWQSEFGKWLGKERITTFAVDNGSKLGEYIKYPATSPVLVLSYEMFTRSFDQIQEHLTFDLIVCDEGHRLKNASIKASQMLAQMSDVERRVVLTGTPLQNELKEFYAIVNVVCPDILGSESKFLRRYEDPIVRSKQPDATPDEVEAGNDMMEELNELTGQFILRRTQDIISKYLPPKTEYVIFCQMTAVQAYVFDLMGRDLDYGEDCVLSNITQFRKVCNHPSLMEEMINDSGGLPSDLETLTYEEQGSKLAVVSCILWALRQKGDERIVLVSISTKVLDLLSELCQHYGYPTLRLDGSTSQAQREQVVQNFNSPHNSQAFVLLLSSKAGGTGLNLIGASRILLFDMDWNPATDVQAMARVWRDGQRRKVHVYRLATAGTIEEKIFQRQVTKQGIGVLSDSTGGKFHFTKDELRDLFSWNPEAVCETHSLLDCTCDGKAELNNTTITQAVQESMAKALPEDNRMRDLLSWRHIDPKKRPLEDSVLATAGNYISYVFANEAVTRAQL